MAVATMDDGIENVLTGIGVERARAEEIAGKISAPVFYKALGQLNSVLPGHLVPLVMKNGSVVDYIGKPEFDKYLGLARSVVGVMGQQGAQLSEVNAGVLNSIELARSYCIAARSKK